MGGVLDGKADCTCLKGMLGVSDRFRSWGGSRYVVDGCPE